MRPALRTGGPRFSFIRIAMPRLGGCFALAVSILGISGCSSGSTAALNYVKKTYLTSSSDPPALDPKFSYLRAVIAEREIYLALGYVDALPEGPTEVWYSGAGEVVRLRNGRIVGTTGLTTDWRAVRFSSEPAWQAAPQRRSTDANDTLGEPVASFSRERDMMPGYMHGVRDRVLQIVIAAPSQSNMRQTHGSGQALHWFEERSTSVPNAAAVRPARFAVAEIEGRPQVVYSEQCLTRALCMSLERWLPVPAVGLPAAAAATGS